MIFVIILRERHFARPVTIRMDPSFSKTAFRGTPIERVESDLYFTRHRARDVCATSDAHEAHGPQGVFLPFRPFVINNRSSGPVGATVLSLICVSRGPCRFCALLAICLSENIDLSGPLFAWPLSSRLRLIVFSYIIRRGCS